MKFKNQFLIIVNTFQVLNSHKWLVATILQL